MSISRLRVLLTGVLLLALLSGLCLGQTVRDSETFEWNEQQVRFDYIAQFAPIFLFHPSEDYTPVNLVDLILNSTLYNNIDGTDIRLTDPNTLSEPKYCCNGTGIDNFIYRNYYLENDPAWVFGTKDCGSTVNLRPQFTTMSNVVGNSQWTRPGGTVTSDLLSMMFSMSTTTYNEKQYAVIAWYLVQPFSAAETLVIQDESRTRLYLYQGTTVADHAADMQVVYTLLDMSLDQVHYVAATSHSNEFYRPTTIIDSHPVLFVSLNTHSVYSSVDLGHTLNSYPRASFITPYPYQSLQAYPFDYFDYQVTDKAWPRGNDTANQTLTDQTCYSDATNTTFACTLYCYVDSQGGWSCEQQPTDGYTGEVNPAASTSVYVVDHWRAGGAVWAPRVQDLYHVGLNANGSSIYPQDKWVKYNGRLGYSSGEGQYPTPNDCINLFCEENKKVNCDPDNDGWLTRLWSTPEAVCAVLYWLHLLSTQGTDNLATRPAIGPVTTKLDAPPSQQSFYPAPQEYPDGLSMGSLSLGWWNSATNQIQREWYFPNNLAASGQAWNGVYPFKPNTPPIAPIDYITGYGLAIAAYQCKAKGGSLCWSLARDYDDQISQLEDMGVLNNEGTATKPKMLLASCGENMCMYYAFVQSPTLQVFVGTEQFWPASNGTWQYNASAGTSIPAVDSDGTTIYSWKTPGFVVFNNKLVLVFVDGDGYMLWATSPIQTSPDWTRIGYLGVNTYVTAGSPGAAASIDIAPLETLYVGFFSNFTKRIMYGWVTTSNNTWANPLVVTPFPIPTSQPLALATYDVTVAAGYFLWIAARFTGALPNQYWKTAVAYGPGFRTAAWIDLGPVDTTTLPALTISEYFPDPPELYPGDARLTNLWPPTPQCPLWSRNGYN